MSAPRWEFDGTPEAASVPPWMRVGDTRDGAMHTILLYLVRNAQAYEDHPEWAYRPFWEITDEALRGRQDLIDDAPAMLAYLAQQGLVTHREGNARGAPNRSPSD